MMISYIFVCLAGVFTGVLIGKRSLHKVTMTTVQTLTGCCWESHWAWV
jgi:hypothetical protein